MDRAGFLILSILQKSGATGRLSSMTVREIVFAEDMGWKENTIYKKIKACEQSGYISRGMKDGRAGTWFFTLAGCRRLEKERNGL